MIEHVYNTFEHLRDWRSLAVYVGKFGAFAEAIHAKGAPLRNLFGFIDGKLQAVARPGLYQGVLYNGNDCVHGLTQVAGYHAAKRHAAVPLRSNLWVEPPKF